MAEINCHGSNAIITKIFKILEILGLRLAEPGEFTRRSLMNDKLDLLQTSFRLYERWLKFLKELLSFFLNRFLFPLEFRLGRIFRNVLDGEFLP